MAATIILIILAIMDTVRQAPALMRKHNSSWAVAFIITSAICLYMALFYWAGLFDKFFV